MCVCGGVGGANTPLLPGSAGPAVHTPRSKLTIKQDQFSMQYWSDTYIVRYVLMNYKLATSHIC